MENTSIELVQKYCHQFCVFAGIPFDEKAFISLQQLDILQNFLEDQQSIVQQGLVKIL